MRFRLSKWYLDCVSPTGEALVLYWAALRWGALRLRYGAVLSHMPTGASRHRATLRPGRPPASAEGGTVRWSSRRLGVRGSWSGAADAGSRTLLAVPDGQIDWHCVCPKAEATVEIDGRAVHGLGYAEFLTTTLAPARFPFDELRWGRFHSSADAIVWIAWRGALSRSWLLANGAMHEQAAISDTVVASPPGDLTLRISDPQVLRAGRLAATVPVPVRPLASLLLGWQDATETKWIGRGTVESPHGTRTGHVIHEVVRWS